MIGGKKTWWWQALSGVALIFLLGLHLFANHFMAGGLLTYDDVVAYLSNPWILTLEVLFLAAVIYHALLGVRALMLDRGITGQQERKLTRILVVIGLVLFLYGIWLFWVILT